MYDFLFSVNRHCYTIIIGVHPSTRKLSLARIQPVLFLSVAPVTANLISASSGLPCTGISCSRIMQYVVLTVWFLSLCSTCLSVHIVASMESIFPSAVEEELTAGICHSFIHLLVHGHWHCSKFGTIIN